MMCASCGMHRALRGHDECLYCDNGLEPPEPDEATLLAADRADRDRDRLLAMEDWEAPREPGESRPGPGVVDALPRTTPGSLGAYRCPDPEGDWINMLAEQAGVEGHVVQSILDGPDLEA